MRRTSLGDTFAYDEVFHAPAPPGGVLTHSEYAHLVCSLLADFFDSIGDSPAAPSLRDWLCTEAQKGLEDARLAVAEGWAGTSPAQRTELGRRILVALTRGGFTATTEIMTAEDDSAEAQPHSLLRHDTLARQIAQRPEFQGELGRRWAPLWASHEFIHPWSSYLERSGAQERITACLEHRAQGAGATWASVCRFLAQHLGQQDLAELLAFPPGSRASTVMVTVACTRRPFRMNGQWREPDGVCWWALARPPSWANAATCYCAWSVAQEAEQSRIFGRVILQDRLLALYAEAWERLSPEQQAGWSRALEHSARARARGEDPLVALGLAARGIAGTERIAEIVERAAVATPAPTVR